MCLKFEKSFWKTIFLTAKTLTLFFLNSSIELSVKWIYWFITGFTFHLSLNFAGGYREVEIPSPIPNLEVKHFIADNTAGSPGGNVGRCQLLSFLHKSFYLFILPLSIFR